MHPSTLVTAGTAAQFAGDVIGINTAVAEAQGIGFAIPSDTVRSVLNDLINEGKVRRGWLGVEIQDVTPTIADQLGLSDIEGVLIRNVLSGGPADRAGLQQGDVILAIDEKEVKDSDELLEQLRLIGPDKRVQITVWRDKNSTKVTVTLGERQ